MIELQRHCLILSKDQYVKIDGPGFINLFVYQQLKSFQSKIKKGLVNSMYRNILGDTISPRR